jgi:Domain of unknown function (DUF5666)
VALTIQQASSTDFPNSKENAMSLRLIDHSRLLQLLATMLFASILLTGCGGGGSGSTAGPKSSFTAGPITGFGSVIINGIRFDVSAASVANDDDEAQRESDLKLGMVAEVESGEITSDSTGSHGDARAIHFRSAIIGPVNAIDTATRLLVVLGQTVDVSNTTVFGDSLPNGPFSISVGDVLEIFGMLDTNTGHYLATRIEAKPNAPFFKLRGMVSNLNTAAHTFNIGSETISYAGLTAGQARADLANGLLVSVKLEKIQVGGAWIATKIRIAAHHMEDHDEAELKGLVTSVTSPTQFSVDGIPVDASSARFRPDGATIVLGAEVEVEGTASNGVIMATKVSIETENEDEHAGFELHGVISAIDIANKTIMLRGVTVDCSGNVQFPNGTISDLAVGKRVEVKGTLSTNGTRLVATTITFEH